MRQLRAGRYIRRNTGLLQHRLCLSAQGDPVPVAISGRVLQREVTQGNCGKHSTPRIIPLLLRETSSDSCGGVLFLEATTRYELRLLSNSRGTS